MSDFVKKMERLGYTLKNYENHKALFQLEQDISTAVIMFYTQEHKISGFLKPNSMIFNVQDITDQYALFRKLIEDIKYLSELSGFEIIQ